ncbi:MAG: hypothetical protein R3E95_03005 [Thiolinea sp.]
MDLPPTHPADWRALGSIALQFWLNGALFSALIPRLPERDQLGVSIEQLGQAMTLAMLGGILGSLTVDRICHHFDLKRIMVGSAALLILGLGVIAFSPTLGLFAAVLGVMLLFDAYVDVAMNIQVHNCRSRRANR